MGLLDWLLGSTPAPPEVDYSEWAEAQIARCDPRAPDARDTPSEQHPALVAGVVVDLASDEYREWYERYYGR